MATHTLVASQLVAQPPAVVVPFFERPENLAPAFVDDVAAAAADLLVRPADQPAVVDPAPLREVLGREMRRLDEGLSTYLGRLPAGSTLSFA